MSRKVIVLATADANLRDQLVTALQRHGYRVETVSDGEEAYDKVRELRPQAVLADLNLHRVDGIELCWLLRSRARMNWLPFLILSPHSDKEVELNAYRSGVDAFLLRPFSVRELMVRLEALLVRYEQIRSLEVRPVYAISGELSEFMMLELIQWLHNNKKTGRLWLSRLYQRGSIYFEQGNIVQARLGDEEGEEAIYKMFRWNEGRFEFELGEPPVLRNVHKSTVEILLECGKRKDEADMRAVQTVSPN